MKWKQITDSLELSNTGFLRHTRSGHGVERGSLRKPHNVGGRIYYLVDGSYCRICDLLKKHFGECEISPDQHWYRAMALLIFQHNLLLRFAWRKKKVEVKRHEAPQLHASIEDIFSNDRWAG